MWSLTINRFLKSTLAMAAALAAITASILSISAPWNRHLRKWLVHSVIESRWVMVSIGILLVLIAIALIAAAIRTSRRRELYFTTAGGAVIVDEGVLEDYLHQYWKRTFPNSEVGQKVIVKRNKVKIIADFPAVPSDEQKQLLEKIHYDLQELLERIVGFNGEFELAYSFK